jgi:hypothetical protein
MWETRNERAPCIFQGQRYAERWCAGRLAPRMRLRAAVARMVDDTPSEPLRPLPALPPTQTAAAGTLLDRGGARDLERVKEALAPIRSPAVMKPRAKDPMKTRVRTGQRELRRGV